MADDSDPIKAVKIACEKLAKVKVKETNELAAELWDLSLNYFGDVRVRAGKSFTWALVFAVTGTAVFILALGLMMSDKLPFSRLTLIAGMLIQVISAINFYLYAQTSRQFFSFHVCLERANRFLLANSMCENLDQPHRDQARQKLIYIIGNASILSFDVVEHGLPRPEQESTKPASGSADDSQ